ncbi:hypothetical protein FXO37_13196 [Capsicum annuum]|nr:hypothetical protein FXO37_13196 [Capsicum annuum]
MAYVCINVDTDDTDLLNQIEVPEIDSAILMSFLDEVPQMEYCDDDEKSKSLIQSLEAEIEYPISIINNGMDDTSDEQVDHVDDLVGWIWRCYLQLDDNMTEFQEESDYSQFLTCIIIEEEVYDSLWLQSDLSMVDNVNL